MIRSLIISRLYSEDRIEVESVLGRTGVSK